MNKDIEKIFEEIQSDKTHGAAHLAARGIELLALACESSPGASAEEILGEIARMVPQIQNLRPSMAAPGNWALLFYTSLKEYLSSSEDRDLPGTGRELADTLLTRMKGNAAGMAEASKPMLQNSRRILTLSDSSSVERVILEGTGASCQITIAESRPLLEGREMLRRIREGGLDVQCITDAEIGLFMKEADILLLGADTICSDMATVNKTGSFPAALTAHHLGKPCAVVADTFKISALHTSESISLEKGPGSEVWEEEPDISQNIYFETVPPDLITCFLTEKGILAHNQIREEVSRWKRLWEAVEITR